MLATTGVLAIWIDADPDRDALFQRWYLREHLAERVGVPGFRRGARFRSLSDPHRYFAMYDVDSPDVLDSAPYYRRLDNPTPLTRETMPAFKGAVRAACDVRARHGGGWAGIAITCRFARTDEDDRRRLAACAADLGTWMETDGPLVRVDLIEGRADLGQRDTTERALRQTPDRPLSHALIAHLADERRLDAVAARIARALVAPVEAWRLLHAIDERDIAGKG